MSRIPHVYKKNNKFKIWTNENRTHFICRNQSLNALLNSFLYTLDKKILCISLLWRLGNISRDIFKCKKRITSLGARAGRGGGDKCLAHSKNRKPRERNCIWFTSKDNTVLSLVTSGVPLPQTFLFHFRNNFLGRGIGVRKK